MGNKPTPWPSLGEAANEYRLPSEQARQKALKQKELAETLKENWRKWIGPRNTLEDLKTWTHIPAAYDAKSQETTHTIKRDPTPYAPIFAKAEQYALELQLQYDDCSPEDLLLIHLIAIQRAIDEWTRPDQKHAEGNLDHLIDETSTKGEVTMSTEDIKAR